MANGAAFIDQNLAAQLFVAARAHDSLRQEPENLLPTAITEIFTIPTSHSHRYRTATYSALAKSQQQQPSNSTAAPLQRLGTFHDDLAAHLQAPFQQQQESKLLQIARNEPRILKKIATYLGINDKQSLMFAVTEENNVSLDKEENHLNSSNNSNPSEMMATNVKGTTGSGGGTSSATTTLAEDIYHRELEEFDHIRSEYLTQLAQTREVESKMDDLQQQIDRTKLILRNSSTTDTHSVVDSGDLLLLNYMASRLYRGKELTSRDYDDFFTARAQYSSWCNDQQQLYLTLGKESLFHQQKYLKISKLIHNLAFEQSKRFLFQITQPSDSHSEHHLPPLLSTQLSTSSSAAASEEMKKVIHFKVRTKVSFDQLAEEGKLIMAQYSNHHLASRSASSPLPLTHPVAISAPLSARTHTSTSPRTGIMTTTGRERSQTTDSSLLFSHRDRDWDKEEMKSSSQRSALSSPQITPRAELPSPGATSAPPTPPSIENLDSLLSEFERELTTSLGEYEQNVCSTMESLSQMSLEAIRKKFVALNDTNELPRYVADIQRRIEEKGTLVTTSSDYTEILKENLTAEFEERIRMSYEWLLEQQMNRLKRIQGRF